MKIYAAFIDIASVALVAYTSLYMFMSTSIYASLIEGLDNPITPAVHALAVLTLTLLLLIFKKEFPPLFYLTAFIFTFTALYPYIRIDWFTIFSGSGLTSQLSQGRATLLSLIVLLGCSLISYNFQNKEQYHEFKNRGAAHKEIEEVFIKHSNLLLTFFLFTGLLTALLIIASDFLISPLENFAASLLLTPAAVGIVGTAAVLLILALFLR